MEQHQHYSKLSSSMKPYEKMTDQEKEIYDTIMDNYDEKVKKIHEEELALQYNRTMYGSEYPNLSNETLESLLRQNKYLN